jgi:hypothetical protein
VNSILDFTEKRGMEEAMTPTDGRGVQTFPVPHDFDLERPRARKEQIPTSTRSFPPLNLPGSMSRPERKASQ